MPESKFTIWLNPEHTAMLDAICTDAGKTRKEIAASILRAVLEDDAACHQGVVTFKEPYRAAH